MSPPQYLVRTHEYVVSKAQNCQIAIFGISPYNEGYNKFACSVPKKIPALERQQTSQAPTPALPIAHSQGQDSGRRQRP